MTEPAICASLDPNEKSTFHLKEYIVHVRALKSLPKLHDEQHFKNYVDHLDSVKVACGSYIEPGFVTNEMFQVTVHKKIVGERIDNAIYSD